MAKMNIDFDKWEMVILGLLIIIAWFLYTGDKASALSVLHQVADVIKSLKK